MTDKIPTIDIEMTGKNIKALRKSKGLTAREIQEVMGFANPTAVYKWEHGDNLPSRQKEGREMSRYIDKDILTQRINTAFWSEVENIINSAPSIDIVSCKECVHANPFADDIDMVVCDACDQVAFDPDHWCSYGERRSDE